MNTDRELADLLRRLQPPAGLRGPDLDDLAAKGRKRRLRGVGLLTGLAVVIVGTLAVLLPSSHASRSEITVRPPTSSAPVPSTSASRRCAPFPPRQAWVQAVSSSGTARWRTALRIGGEAGGESLQPLLINGLVVVAQDGALSALDQSDGLLKWSWIGGKSVYGMWRSGDIVVVLTDQVGTHGAFTALRLTDGHVIWRRAVPQGYLGNVIPTGAGRLVGMRADGVLQVLRMSDGTVLWSHATGRSPYIAAIDGRVFFGAKHTVTAYDEITGRTDWVSGSLPDEDPYVSAQAGLVLVVNAGIGGKSPTPLIALDPANGTVRWHFDVGASLGVLGSGQGRILVGALYSKLYQLDAVTGAQRWTTGAAINPDEAPLLLPNLIVNYEGVGRQTQLVARAAQTGHTIWAVPIAGLASVGTPLLQVGSLITLLDVPTRAGAQPALTAYEAGSGHKVWSLPMPLGGSTPAAATASTIFIQSADGAQSCAA